MSLESVFWDLCKTNSDIQHHLPRFAGMVLNLDARHVIELGTRTGISTVAWLYALGITGGHLTSVDLLERPENIPEFPHWDYIQGDDLDPAVISQLSSAEIVFIDTSHTYDQTAAELRAYRPLVRRGGRIVCHDTQLEHPPGAPLVPAFPVRQAVVEYVEAEGLRWTEYEDSFGLAVIEVD